MFIYIYNKYYINISKIIYNYMQLTRYLQFNNENGFTFFVFVFFNFVSPKTKCRELIWKLGSVNKFRVILGTSSVDFANKEKQLLKLI